MYDRHLETVRGAKAVYDERQKDAAATRLKEVARKKKAKKASKKEAQA
jgi:hypothetical protein